MGIYSGRNEMSLSYNDLTLLRYIQKRQMIPLSKTALHFQKNESSIRRTIEQINLYSSEPMVRIEKSICYSCISYEDLVSFIRNLDQKDYLSSSDERIRVMITAIFFQNYVNSSKLYEQWGLSLTTKKQDTALLRQFLTRYGLELVTKKKKGLSIQGDELQLRFLVIDILHPLFEFTSENKVLARFANTPLEKQTYELATEYLSCSFQEATEILSRFLSETGWSLNYPSKKFLLLFICIMKTRTVKDTSAYSYKLPLAPLNIHFTDSPRQNRLYNVALSMLNFAQPLKLPFDPRLWQATENFTEQIVSELPSPFPVQDEFLRELYAYFYREINLDHFHCTFVDKTVEDTKGHFPVLYEQLKRYSIIFKAAYGFTFLDEHLSTLTLIFQKHILRNQTVSRNRKRIIVMTSINFERISFFLEQLREHISFQWISTLNINEIHQLEQLEYDYIFCFSTRIYNILHNRKLPVIRMNFFVKDTDIDHLLEKGFSPQTQRFLTSSFVVEAAGKSEGELTRFLREQYGDYFV